MTLNGDGIGSGFYNSSFLWRNLSASPAASFQSVIGMRGSAPSNNSTSNTFGSIQIYLPNYSGSATKTGSIDSVSENNESASGIALTTFTYNKTDAINSFAFLLSNGNFVAGTIASLYGITKGSSGGVVVS